MRLFYADDPDWPIEIGDEVAVVAAEHRFPAVVKKVLPKVGKILVSFENIDPVLDLIVLRKTARVPISAMKLMQRGW